MKPYLDIFGFELPTYGLISFVGALVAALVVILFIKRRRLDKNELFYIAFFAGVGMFLGAHILYALTRIEDITAAFSDYKSFDSFWSFAKYIYELSSGMVFYGGLYGGLLCGFLWARYKKYRIAEYADVFAVAIPLFHSFGRVGCFFAGCCYGVEWEWGFSGRVLPSEAKEHIRRLPIQLIEATLLIFLFALLCVLFLRNVARGKLMTFYLSSYAVLRFALEFFRGDEVRGHFYIFSTSQWISLITLIFVAVYFIFRKAYCRNSIASQNNLSN